METQGHSVQQCSEATGISTSTLYAYRRDPDKTPKISAIGKLQQAYPELNLIWLLTGTGSMLQEPTMPMATESTTQFGNIKALVDGVAYYRKLLKLRLGDASKAGLLMPATELTQQLMNRAQVEWKQIQYEEKELTQLNN